MVLVTSSTWSAASWLPSLLSVVQQRPGRHTQSPSRSGTPAQAPAKYREDHFEVHIYYLHMDEREQDIIKEYE